MRGWRSVVTVAVVLWLAGCSDDSTAVGTDTTATTETADTAVSDTDRDSQGEVFEERRREYCASADSEPAAMVYMEPTAAEEQIDAMGDFLADQNLGEIEYFDQAASYERFQQLFQDDPSIVAAVHEADLPTSFSIEEALPDELRDELTRMPGVYTVDSPDVC
jgi:hypothetical protein